MARLPERTALRVAAALAVAALAAAAAGCGGSSGGSETTATESWANGVCSAFSQWRTTLEGVKSDLSGSSLSKESLTNAADTVKSANKTLEDDLSSLDRPQTDAGKQAAEQLDTLQAQLKSGFDSIQKSLSGGVTLASMSTAATALQTMASQLQTAFDNLQQLDAKGEVSQAFKDSPACEQFQKKKK